MLAAVVYAFVFGYPIVMSWVWMVGGLYFFVHRELRAEPLDQPPDLPGSPLVSILIPCHNEGPNVAATVTAALRQSYRNLEVIAVNDGSTDDTGPILDALAAREPALRVLHLASNQGKAVGLRTAALAARSDYLVCVDGDVVLEEHAASWLVWHLITGARVAAVTGNPRVRNRNTVLGLLQAGEFSSIVGLIKRAQRTYGRVFTISGAVCAIRRTALHDVGFWSPTAITEDIDISWRLQVRHWDIRYEPRALASVVMPDSWRGLWKQRLRWARGGIQLARTQLPTIWTWRSRRLWPLVIENLCSLAWAWTLAGVTLFSLAALAVPGQQVPGLGMPDSIYTVALASTCLLQFCVSLLIDRRYERGHLRDYLWIIWYPFAFWLLGWVTVMAALPWLFLGHGRRAVWTPPDRGSNVLPRPRRAVDDAPQPVEVSR